MKKTNTKTVIQTELPQYVTINGKEVKLESGMGVTACYGSDCKPYTLWAWTVSKTGRIKIYVTSDNATPVEKFEYYGNQNYNYTSNPPTAEQPSIEILLTSPKCRFYVGNRRKYSDPSF